MASERVEVECPWCYGDGEETEVLGEAAFKRPCHRCGGAKSTRLPITGRDSLVYRLGLADIEVHDASEHRQSVESALCRQQNVPFAPTPTPELLEADRRLSAAIEKKAAARTALRAFDAREEGDRDTH